MTNKDQKIGMNMSPSPAGGRGLGWGYAENYTPSPLSSPLGERTLEDVHF
jgi:hypothetical protein